MDFRLQYQMLHYTMYTCVFLFKSKTESKVSLSKIYGPQVKHGK